MKKRRIPREIELAVFKRDNFTCQYCDFVGDTFEKWIFLQVDHFIPKSKKGTDDMENLVTSCMLCNAMKQAMEFKSIEEARKEVKKWLDIQLSYYKNSVLGQSS